ncbi:MAG: N-acetyltransferase family protein [Planctomycetota bacterium]
MKNDPDETIAVRFGTAGDLPALTTLYNHYITTTPITFDTETYADREAWFAQFADTGPHQLWVATVADTPVGYASSTCFRPKAAYSTSVEVTVYCDEAHTGQGIGARLYSALFAALETEDLHRAYAGITVPNEASEALHRRFGFEKVAFYHEVGRKFGRYWDVAWYEKRLA